MSKPTESSRPRGDDLAWRPAAGLPSLEQGLAARVSALIDSARYSIASYANATLTMTYWQIGSIIDSEVLREERAEYGAQTLVTLSHELTARYGKGFDRANLSRMVTFARLFPDREIVVTLSHKLSWSHVLALLPLRSDDARAFYAKETVAGRYGSYDTRLAAKPGSAEGSPTHSLDQGRRFLPTPSAIRTCSTSSDCTTVTSKRTWKRRFCVIWKGSCWK